MEKRQIENMPVTGATAAAHPCHRKHLISMTAWIIMIFTAVMTAKADTAGISANMEPASITQDTMALLTVTVTGARDEEPRIEPVEGLEFTGIGKRVQYRNVNGASSSSSEYRYLIKADRPGTYDIPPVSVKIDGTALKTQAMRLSVKKPHINGTAALSRPPVPGGNAPATGNESPRPAFIRINPEKETLYAGEKIPITINAFFRQGVQASVTSLPFLRSDALAVDSVNAGPEQKTEMIGGMRYTVVTWHSAISGIKPGRFPVNAELRATMPVRHDALPRSSMFGRNFFDDDFFNSFFQRTQRKEITLSSGETMLTVLPLPEKGKPAHFSGAVGRFTLSAKASPVNVSQGDPITMTVNVKGHGNFDMVQAPVLSDGDGWKTYAPAPTFTPGDSAGLNGEKVFEQALIPEDGSISEIPPFSFSYFDPDEKKYATVKTDSIPVSITQKSEKNIPPAQTAVSADIAGKKEKAQTEASVPGAGKIKFKPAYIYGEFQKTLLKPWFLIFQAAFLSVFIGGTAVVLRKKWTLKNPDRLIKKRVKQNIKAASEKMDAAIAGNSAETFFYAARYACREKLGEMWKLPPEAITLADVKKRLPEGRKTIRDVFETADEAAYSGRISETHDLGRLKKALMEELEGLSCTTA